MLTTKDLEEYYKYLSKEVKDQKYTLILNKAAYDKLTGLYGENCGYDKNKVKVIRGYPKFN